MIASKTLQEQFCEGGEWMPLPNWVIDEMLSDKSVPDSVVRVFLYLFRATVGRGNPDADISLDTIMEGANVARASAVYAMKVLIDCWQLWSKVRGQKGKGFSRFTPVCYGQDDIREVFRDTFRERCVLMIGIYGHICPTSKQLKDKPPTEDFFDVERQRLEAIEEAEYKRLRSQPRAEIGFTQ